MAETNRLKDLMKAGDERAPHGTALGISEQVIGDVAEAMVAEHTADLRIGIAETKLGKSGAGEGYVNAAVGVLKKMEKWFSGRHADNESKASSRLQTAESRRQKAVEIARAKADKLKRKETYNAAKAQFEEVSPKGMVIAAPEFPNILNDVKEKFNDWRAKANEAKAESFNTRAARYKDIASKLRDAANSIESGSVDITTRRHDAAEQGLNSAQTEMSSATKDRLDRESELDRLRQADYLQRGASGGKDARSMAEQIIGDKGTI